MPRAYEVSEDPGAVVHITLRKAHTFVAGEYRIRYSDFHVLGSHLEGDVHYFVASWLAFCDFPAQACERRQKEGLDEMGFEFSRLHTLHVLANGHDAMNVHDVCRERVRMQKLLDLSVLKGRIDHLVKPIAHIRAVPVTDGFDE